MNPDHPKAIVGFIEPMAATGATALELDIGRQVYALYGLTPEEIAIVEGAAK